MRKISITIIALFILGCPGTVTRLPAPRSDYLAVPKSIFESGNFKHQSSGMIFPKSIKGFTRVKITQYDIDGHNVSVGYNSISPKGNLICTVYIYPAPRMTYLNASNGAVKYLTENYLSKEIERVKAEILTYHPNWKQIREGKSRLHQSYEGKMIVFNYQENSLLGLMDILSAAHVYYVDYKWYVKFRFTYPAMSADYNEPKINKLIQSLKWP